jgi:hypothetical protein
VIPELVAFLSELDTVAPAASAAAAGIKLKNRSNQLIFFPSLGDEQKQARRAELDVFFVRKYFIAFILKLFIYQTWFYF